MTMAIFQIESDLHLEFRKRLDFNTFLPKQESADYLILAGDICPVIEGSYKSLLEYCNRTWKKTFVVSGNHEYYGSGKEDADAAIRVICGPLENIVYLHKETYRFGDLSILGTTLWSDPGTSKGINDRHAINDVDSTIIAGWHHDESAWLDENISKEREAGQNILCITHHMPSYILIAPGWEGNPINACFASNLDHLVAKCKYWVCGHTHTRMQKVISGCEVLINPRGYPGESTYEPMLLEVPVIP